jgi:hypothetical protein
MPKKKSQNIALLLCDRNRFFSQGKKLKPVSTPIAQERLVVVVVEGIAQLLGRWPKRGIDGDARDRN